MKNQQVIANLVKAIEIISAVPEEKLNLQKFKSACGTIACTAGTLASHPYFQNFGLGLILNPDPDSRGREYQPFVLVSEHAKYMDGAYRIFRSETDGFAYLNTLFGAEAFDRLFAERNEGVWDWEITGHREIMSDKQLAIARLLRQRDEYIGRANDASANSVASCT